MNLSDEGVGVLAAMISLLLVLLLFIFGGQSYSNYLANSYQIYFDVGYFKKMMFFL